MVGKDPSASLKRRKTSVDHVQEEDDDDDNSLTEDEIVYLDETARQNAVEDIMSQIGLIQTVTHDGRHDICEHSRRDTLSRFRQCHDAQGHVRPF